ncbi:MAG: A24 family peptidase, partial [bacterium]|nr:A24 family peptidase [bacterium]
YGTALKESLLGILVGGGVLFLVGFLYEKIRGQEGLGGGDVKLAALLGAFLGWQKVLFLLPMGALAGFLVALVLILFYKKGLKFQLPFGPFLSLAALIQLYYGEAIIQWYVSSLSLFRIQ